jgi:UDP-glucose 4-epimerase
VADVVVLGGNGFIGAHVVDRLVVDGHRVAVFGRPRSAPPRYRSADVTVIEGDFANTADLRAAVRGAEIVIHLLSTTTPASAEADASVDVRTNVIQSIALLESCVEAAVGHVYFASTGGAIYGSQGRSSYAETDPTEPVSPYAIGKLAIEGYLRYFHAVAGLRSTALRISNPYGPGQQSHRRQGFIPIALRAILEGRPMTRYGDGSMVRDYLYVEDLADMFSVLVRRVPERFVYNLGSGLGVTVDEVIDALRRVCDMPFTVEDRPTPVTFVDRVVLDSTRFRSEFGDLELTALDEGIRRTLHAMRAEPRG